MAISLFFFLFLILSVSFISAAIMLQAPASVVTQEAFTVTLTAETTEKNDVKIYIRNDSEAILSEIQDSDWKNGRYYVNDAYPQKNEYTLRAIAFSEKTQLCAKLRLSEKRKTKPPTPESCISISVEKSLQSSPRIFHEEAPVREEREESSPKIKKPVSKKNVSQDAPLLPPSRPLQVQQAPQSAQEVQEETISLNAPLLTGKVIITNQQKSHLAMMAAFSVFVILILIWMMRQEKRRREQENI